MNVNPHQALQAAKESLRHDLARLSFDGHIVTGPAKLISIDMAAAKMFVRRTADDKNPCCIALPTEPGEESSNTLMKIMMHPAIMRHGPEIRDEVTSTLWAYINIRLLETPVNPDSITVSPEAESFQVSWKGSIC